MWLGELAVQHNSFLLCELVRGLVAKNMASDQIRGVDILDLMVDRICSEIDPKVLWELKFALSISV